MPAICGLCWEKPAMQGLAICWPCAEATAKRWAAEETRAVEKKARRKKEKEGLPSADE